MSAAIATYGLTKEFPSGGGIRSLSFQIHPGEVLGVVGPPGSGKSTLLNLLATRLPATHGSFTLLGHRVPAYRPAPTSIRAVRRSIGVLLEDAPVAGDLSGWENAWILARLHRLPRPEAARRLQILFDWAEMGTAARRPARTYSYPMRRKLGVIGALVHDPRVLLLDDPFHGLEMAARVALQTLLLQARQKGTTIVITSGSPREAGLLCTRLILMDGGRILAEGPAPDLLGRVGSWSAIEVRLDAISRDLNLSRVPGVCGPAEYTGTGVRVRVADPDAALPPLLAAVAESGGHVNSVEVKRP